MAPSASGPDDPEPAAKPLPEDDGTTVAIPGDWPLPPGEEESPPPLPEVAVTLTMTVTNRWVGEGTIVHVTAERTDDAPVAGKLVLDFADGSEDVLDAFEDEVAHPHVYANAGDYTIKAKLTGPGLVPSKALARILVLDHHPVGDGTDHLDLSQVTWIDPDISGWPAVSTMTGVGIEPQQICLHHTHASTWPAVNNNPGDPLAYGNPWVFAWIDGAWYAGTYEWMRPAQECKALDPDAGGETVADRIGPHVKREPILSWRPSHGDLVGFMYSGWARFGQFHANSVKERSNVVVVEWPY